MTDHYQDGNHCQRSTKWGRECDHGSGPGLVDSNNFSNGRHNRIWFYVDSESFEDNWFWLIIHVDDLSMLKSIEDLACVHAYELLPPHPKEYNKQMIKLNSICLPAEKLEIVPSVNLIILFK